MKARAKPGKRGPLSLPSVGKKRPVARRIGTFADTACGGEESDDDENELSGSDETPRVVEKEFSDNPIVAAVEQCLHRHGEVHLTAVVDYRYEAAAMQAMIHRVFDDEAFRQIGTVVIEAMLAGNSDFVATVKSAIKEADRVFHRDREKELLDKFAPFVWSFGETIPPKRELLRMFAERNNGKAITEQQWRRLRKALNLQEGRTGRPNKADTKL